MGDTPSRCRHRVSPLRNAPTAVFLCRLCCDLYVHRNEFSLFAEYRDLSIYTALPGHFRWSHDCLPHDTRPPLWKGNMRIYSALDEEKLRARRLVRGWTADRYLSDAQRQKVDLDTDTSLRRANGFLRAVLFLFTMGSVAAGVALVFELWSIRDRGAIAMSAIVFATVS